MKRRLSIVILFLLVLFSSKITYGADWPMWRYDANRSAASEQKLPAKLHLHWIRQYPPLEPAWEDPINQDRMPFDRVYEPVVMGTTMFIGSNRSDSVVALDTRTGSEKWKVYVDGPVRLPLVAAKQKVYFVSDDGYLYCVNAETGALIWKFRGGPSDQKVLGNSRLISTWPARGGPVIKDGIIYFSASIWPFMGIFIHAVDAETGKVVWTNDGAGSTYMPQPHDGDGSFAGIAPQGSFTAIADRLIIPGRCPPACFDRKNGKFLYLHLSGNRFLDSRHRTSRKREGGSHVSAIGEFFFNHRGRNTTMYDLENGRAYIMWRKTTYPVLTNDVCYLSGNPVIAYSLKSLRATGGKPAWEMDKLWECAVDANSALIKAGNCLYAGGENVVSAIDVSKNNAPQIVWTSKIQGTAARIIAADERLFVVTLEGRIYAFGAEKKEPKIYTPRPSEGRDTPAVPKADTENCKTEKKALEILKSTGVKAGYALVYGIDDRCLLESLARNSQLHIIAVNPNPQKVNELRKYFNQADLYGKRIAIHQGTPITFDAPPYIASLTIVEQPGTSGYHLDTTLVKKVYYSMRPYGGVAYLPVSTKPAIQHLLLSDAKLPGAEISETGGIILLKRSGPLPGSGDWTGQYGNAANTVKSDDKLVKLPLGLLWFGGNSHHDILPRHGHGPPEQIIGGRLFIEGINMLSARDVYTGRVLWKRTFPDLGTFGIYYDDSYTKSSGIPTYGQRHIPGANARGTNYAVTADKIYLLVGVNCLVMEPATGKTIMTLSLPTDVNEQNKATWGYIGVYEDLLIAGSQFIPFSKKYEIKKDRWHNYDITSSKKLVVMDRHTGKVHWTLDSKYAFRHNAIAAGDGKLFCIDALPPFVLETLKRRGQNPDANAVLKSLDVRTGKLIWSKTESVFGTWLGYSKGHDILLQSGRSSRDMIRGEPSNRMITYRGKDGSVVWDKPIHHSGPCMLHGDTIYLNAYSSEGSAVSLLTGRQKMRKHPLTGEQIPWRYYRRYGCNSCMANEHFLSFRSGAAGYCDLDNDGGTGNLGGFKSGCTSNLIAADGVLNAPDYTRTCRCSYQNQTSLALIHAPDAEMWTFNEISDIENQSARIRQLGLNFGAPGDRRTENGTLWLDCPSVGGPSPKVDVILEPWSEQIQYDGRKKKIFAGDIFRHHSSRINSSDLKWVTASGLAGVTSVTVRLAENTEPIIDRNAKWQYLAGPHPQGPWTEVGFKPQGWKLAAAGFGYSDNDDNTILEDMRGKYSVVYIRKPFYVTDVKDICKLMLRIRYDDAFIAYLNGREILRVGVGKARGANASEIKSHEAGNYYERFEIKDHRNILHRGTNILAIEGHNYRTDDRDFTLDPYLVRDKKPDKIDKRLYTVRLYVAEPDNFKPGQRVFNVAIQEKEMLKNFDIVAEAGGANRGLVKEFRKIAVADILKIALTPAPGKKAGPILCGIEIVPEGW